MDPSGVRVSTPYTTPGLFSLDPQQMPFLNSSLFLIKTDFDEKYITKNVTSGVACDNVSILFEKD